MLDLTLNMKQELSSTGQWPQQTWAEKWGGAAVPLSLWESWVPIQHNVARAEAYLHAKFHLHPSNRLSLIHISEPTRPY